MGMLSASQLLASEWLRQSGPSKDNSAQRRAGICRCEQSSVKAHVETPTIVRAQQPKRANARAHANTRAHANAHVHGIANTTQHGMAKRKSRRKAARHDTARLATAPCKDTAPQLLRD